MEELVQRDIHVPADLAMGRMACFLLYIQIFRGGMLLYDVWHVEAKQKQLIEHLLISLPTMIASITLYA
jgi:hypothetical protein